MFMRINILLFKVNCKLSYTYIHFHRIFNIHLIQAIKKLNKVTQRSYNYVDIVKEALAVLCV